MILEKIVVGDLEVNCYILGSEKLKEALIIDPGSEPEIINKVLDKYKLKPKFIVNTHGHIDHIASDDDFGVPVFVHKDDAPLLKDPQKNLSSFLSSSFFVKSQIMHLEDKQEIKLGEIVLEVIHTPGHTPGGIALLLKEPQTKILFTGDSLFYGSIGRTDFPGASQTQLLNSIKQRLLIFSDDTVIYPGHGPKSTIGKERKDNPFLNT